MANPPEFGMEKSMSKVCQCARELRVPQADTGCAFSCLQLYWKTEGVIACVELSLMAVDLLKGV